MSNPMMVDRSLGSLAKVLEEGWWLFLLRGLAAIGFGILAIIWPGVTLLTLVLFYGAFMLVDGVLALAAAITGNTGNAPRWWLVVGGLLGIAAGIVTFVWPGLTTLVLLFFISAWAVALGIMQIVGAIQLRKEIDNEWFLILSGIVSVLFGAILIFAPSIGVVTMIWMMAFYAILFGVILVAFAFRLKKRKDRKA